MSKVYQKIELTANIPIVVAVLTAGVFAQRDIFQNAFHFPEHKTPITGNKISGAAFRSSKSGKNALPGFSNETGISGIEIKQSPSNSLT
jgi:hypothetical protein